MVTKFSVKVIVEIYRAGAVYQMASEQYLTPATGR